MKTPRVHSAYGLEIVVADTQMKRTGQILAELPGRVECRVSGPPMPGWIRLVLVTQREEDLPGPPTSLVEARLL